LLEYGDLAFFANAAVANANAEKTVPAKDSLCGSIIYFDPLFYSFQTFSFLNN